VNLLLMLSAYVLSPAFPISRLPFRMRIGMSDPYQNTDYGFCHLSCRLPAFSHLLSRSDGPFPAAYREEAQLMIFYQRV
jgi:hypothetical protein